MTLPVFTYGILQFPEILKALLSRVPVTVPARLSNYERLAKPVVGGVMGGPGLFKCPGKYVEGLLLTGLSDTELALVDWLERNYIRKKVVVTRANGDVAAQVYLPKDRGLYTAEPWSTSQFKDFGLAYYVTERIPQLLAEYETAKSTSQ